MKSALICGVGILGVGSLYAQEASTTAERAAAPERAATVSAGDSKPAAGANAREFPEKEFYTKDEVRALRKVLEAKSQQLDQDIETKKVYVESLNKRVSEQLAKMESARNEIADFMNARDEKEETKLKKLARFYEAMDAEQAAPLFAKIDDELAIKIFDRMDTKKAGAVLALVPAQRAAKITSSFPRLRLQTGSKAQEAQ